MAEAGEDPETMPEDVADARAFVRSTYQRMKRASAGLPVRRRQRNPRKDSSQQAESASEGWQPPPGIARSRRGAGKSYYDPQPLGDVLDTIGRQDIWQESLSLGSIAARWENIVGEQVASHCHIESFEDQKLQVRADSTAWAHQLRLLLPQIERRVAEELGPDAVRQVIVHSPKPPSWNYGKLRVPGRGPRDTYG